MLCKAVLITFLHYTAGASMHIALKLCRVCRIYNAQLLTLDVTKIWSSCRGIKSRLTQLGWNRKKVLWKDLWRFKASLLYLGDLVFHGQDFLCSKNLEFNRAEIDEAHVPLLTGLLMENEVTSTVRIINHRLSKFFDIPLQDVLADKLDVELRGRDMGQPSSS